MKRTLVSLTVFASLCLWAYGNSAQQQSGVCEHAAWIGKSLDRIQAIQIGATREDLLKVFTTEGGLSTRMQRTFVYRDCPYIKVDVEFEPVGDKQDKLKEYPDDKIIKISRPYLAQAVLD